MTDRHEVTSTEWCVTREPVELLIEVCPVPFARVRLVAGAIKRGEQARGNDDAGDRHEAARVIARADRSEPNDQRKVCERSRDPIDRGGEGPAVEHRLRLYELRARRVLADEAVDFVDQIRCER